MNNTAIDQSRTAEPANYIKGRILIVDDEEAIRKLLRRVLDRDGYACWEAANAEEAIRLISSRNFDLVLSDIMMPGKSGIQLLDEISKNHPDLATVIISGQGNKETAEAAISMGAYGYLYKPFRKDQVLISVSNALRRRKLEIQNKFEVENLARTIEDRTQDLFVANEKLKKTFEGIIKAMARAIESRDPYTAGHQQRVANLAVAIADEMGFTNERLECLWMAGILHDIGKISIPAEFLSKPTRLSAAEMNIIKEHPKTGYDILKEIDFPCPVAEIVYQHHERINGSGYPRGLSNDRIISEAKVLGVADVVEAIASHRPYRPANDVDVAIEEITKNRGLLYDPEVVDVCCRILKDKDLKQLAGSGFNMVAGPAEKRRVRKDGPDAKLTVLKQ